MEDKYSLCAIFAFPASFLPFVAFVCLSCSFLTFFFLSSLVFACLLLQSPLSTSLLMIKSPRASFFCTLIRSRAFFFLRLESVFSPPFSFFCRLPFSSASLSFPLNAGCVLPARMSSRWVSNSSFQSQSLKSSSKISLRLILIAYHTKNIRSLTQMFLLSTNIVTASHNRTPTHNRTASTITIHSNRNASKTRPTQTRSTREQRLQS